MQLMESILAYDSKTTFFSDVGFVNFCTEKSNDDIFEGKNSKKSAISGTFCPFLGKKIFLKN